jgi:uncharacterized protein (TIGR00303 family)
MVKLYTRPDLGQAWLRQMQGKRPRLALVLGFTETALLPGISAAGATPAHRRYTAVADAEFLVNGPTEHPKYPLPPLDQGASPVYITRAVVDGQGISTNVFNAGLPATPSIPHIDLAGQPAQCLTTGRAMCLSRVYELWQQGLHWGKILAAYPEDYLLLAECVVGGTTTALALLTGLGVNAAGKVNSSHPRCNHRQKLAVVQQGLGRAGVLLSAKSASPLEVVAAVGDPMQPVVAGMAMAASSTKPVMLAGGTQMLAVYRLMTALEKAYGYPWLPQQVVVGTTRWVAEDPTGDTAGLATEVEAALIGSQLSFRQSRFGALRAYESGFVKEGVGAGACAIAASLYQNWKQPELLDTIEALLEQTLSLTSASRLSG